MTVKEFVSLVSKELYTRAGLAEGFEARGQYPPGSVVFRASAGIIETMYRQHEAAIQRTAKQANAIPLVIVEGSDIEGTEAVLVGDVNAVIIDWESLEDSPDRARDIAVKIRQYFNSTELPTGARVDGILERLASIIRGDEDDDFDDEPEGPRMGDEEVDEVLPGEENDPDRPRPGFPMGSYKGIAHTGDEGCPACDKAAEDMGFNLEEWESKIPGQPRDFDPSPSPTMNLGGFDPSYIERLKEQIDSLPVDQQRGFKDRLAQVVFTMLVDREGAKKLFEEFKRDYRLG
jgi:hypothetical protein